MKALVYTQPYRLEYRDEPGATGGPDDAIVKVEAVGICGSDMHAWHGHDPRRVPPLILGHEAAGLAISGPFAGRRVVINPLVTCNACDACLSGRSNLCPERSLIGMNRPGAFAEMTAVAAKNLIPVPHDFPATRAALAEPAATALHAVNLSARAGWRPLSEARALVLGGGSVGLLAALCLRAEGCREVVLGETNPRRRVTAERTGAATVYDPAEEQQAPLSDSIDVVIDAVGADATRAAAVRLVRPGGVIVHIGLVSARGEMDMRKITLAEVTLVGTYTYTMVDMRAAVTLLTSGALGSLDWVEERPLADGGRAFDDLERGRTGAAKVVLRP